MLINGLVKDHITSAINFARGGDLHVFLTFSNGIILSPLKRKRNKVERITEKQLHYSTISFFNLLQTTLYRKHSNRTVFFWPMSRASVCRLTMNDFSSEENMEPVIFPPRSRKDSNLLFSDGILARNVPFQVFEGSIPTLPGNENFLAWCVFCRGYGCP